MSRIYLPNSNQFKKMNTHLREIANSVVAQTDISNWGEVQRAVKLGIAPDILPVGSQLIVPHSEYGELPYKVVAHDHYKSIDDENAHTMTIMCDKAIEPIQYDGAEAFYYADAELPAGTYNFMISTKYILWKEGFYQFTLKRAVPAGGHLTISGTAFNELTTLTVTVYSSANSTTPVEAASITSGSGGTSLGTLGEALNNPRRVSCGSNNYKESALRQFLNSSSPAGSVWTPQTRYDRPPNWVSHLDGFAKGLDEDFLSVVGEVVVPCSSNITYESSDSDVTIGDKYTLSDKFYIPSQKEIYGKDISLIGDDSVLFPYYADAANVDRIATTPTGTATAYWTRTAHKEFPTNVYLVSSDGGRSDWEAYNTTRVTPLCTIV